MVNVQERKFMENNKIVTECHRITVKWCNANCMEKI